MSDCTGRGTCHGCLRWCDHCGDVGNVCDDPECDTHRRPEEIGREREELVREIKVLAQVMWTMEHGEMSPAVRRALKGLASDLKRTEVEEARLEEELRSAEEAGGRLCPRREKREPEEDRQLSLF